MLPAMNKNALHNLLHRDKFVLLKFYHSINHAMYLSMSGWPMQHKKGNQVCRFLPFHKKAFRECVCRQTSNASSRIHRCHTLLQAAPELRVLPALLNRKSQDPQAAWAANDFETMALRW